MRFRILPLLPLALAAQPLSFEVASVRSSGQPSTPSAPCNSLTVSSESVLSTGVHTFRTLVTEAYADQADDFDLPVWTNSSRFSVSVKIPPKTRVAECRAMLRSLLAERFHLLLAEEHRQLPRYFLKVAKSGLKLKQTNQPATDTRAGVTSAYPREIFRGTPFPRIVNSIEVRIELDARFRGIERHKVVLADETGLSGFFDGDWEFTLPAFREEFPLTESLQDALVRQLGLQLEVRKAPGRVLVLRSSDQLPTDN